MGELRILKKTELLGRQLTVYGTAEQPLFLAQDVAEMVDIKNISDLMKRVDDDEKTLVNTIGLAEGITGNPNKWFLTEDGLYEVLMQSRKPEAKAFKTGVKAILKEIRKTGGYLAASPDDTPEMIMAKALKVADATMRRQDAELKAAKSTLAALKEAIGKADFLLRGEAAESEMGSVETASSSAEVAEPAPAPFGKMALSPDEKYVKVVEDPRYEDPSDYWKKDGMDNWLGLGSYARPKAMSATRLLKKTQAGGVGFPEFRDAMRRGGYLERVGIKTKDGRWETHCRLTKRGLHWGFNESHGQDTKVYYYVDRFDDLIDCLCKRGLLS